LGSGDLRVHTVEHLLAAVHVLELDNLAITVDGPEIPVADGSFRPFYELLTAAGSQEQSQPARVIVLAESVNATGPAGASYVAVPADRYRVSATIEFDHPLVRRQYASFDVTAGEFEREIAPARTFGFLKEAEALRARGLALGASH